MFADQSLYPEPIFFLLAFERLAKPHPLSRRQVLEVIVQQNMQDRLTDDLAFLISQNGQGRSIRFERVFSPLYDLNSLRADFMGEEIRARDRLDETILARA